MVKMSDGRNAIGKNAIRKKCQMVEMPVVKMSNGKNTTKQSFFANFLCVVSTCRHSEHEVPGT